MTEENKNSKNKKTSKRSKLSVVIIILVVILAIVMVIFGKNISSIFSKEEEPQTEEFYYESYSKNTFGWLYNSLVIASSAGVEICGGNGEVLSSEIFVMESPAMDISGKYGVVYDIGGTSVRVIDSSGHIKKIENAESVISAGINKNGWTVLITEEDGYKAAVTVYNDEQTAVYKWYSANGYVLSADISPSNEEMSVACIGESGSYINVFNLSSEEVKYTYSGENSLIIAVEYINNNRIYAVSESRTVTLDNKLNVLNTLEFGESALTDYATSGSNFTVTAISKYYSGNIGELKVTDVDGEITASIDTDKRIMSVSSAGDYVAVLYSDSVVIYNKDLTQYSKKDNIQGVREILMLSSGTVILLSSYSAVVYNP